jgi:hypothetical protein
MVQKIRHEYFFYLFVFTLFFGVLLYNMTGFKAVDEIAGIMLLTFYGFYVYGTKNRNVHAGILITLIVFLFYLFYSFYIAYNTRSAITLDFLVQIRPYLTFFMVMQMAPSFSGPQKRLLKRLCFYMWLLFIPIGCYGLITPSVFNTAMEQPTHFVTSIVCLSVVYLYCGQFTVKERLNFMLMLSTGLIAAHAKFYGFFLLTAGILLYFGNPKVFKYNMRTGMVMISVMIAVFCIAKSQITYYLFPSGIAGSEYDFTARSSLYQTAVDILKDFFPLGSGFASFATHASGLYYSQIYSEYGLNSVDGLMPQAWFSVSDSYYPSLAQFGILGIALYLFFWVYTVSKSLIRLKQQGDIQPFVILLILSGFVFIENISDSFFSSNKGFFMMMFFGLFLGEHNIFTSVRPTEPSGDSDVPVEENGFFTGGEDLPAYEPLPDDMDMEEPATINNKLI